ncbi:MAG: hypothetical protein AB1576_07650 [Bacillota bacterium]|jgi:Rod binding domain-containing protein
MYVYGIQGSAGRHMEGADVNRAAKELEAVFLSLLLNEVLKGTMEGSGQSLRAEREMWGPVLSLELARRLADKGTGIQDALLRSFGSTQDRPAAVSK